MRFAVAVAAKPDQMKKWLVKEMGVGHVMHFLNRLGFASLANSVLPPEYSVSFQLPFVGIKVGKISPSLFCGLNWWFGQ